MRNVNWRKAAVIAVVWLGVGLVVALALVSGAGAKPGCGYDDCQTTTVPATTVVDTTLPPPTTTLCNYSYKNCQPVPEPTLPADVEDDGDVAPPPPPPVAAQPRTAG
jgi:hypothetical protein